MFISNVPLSIVGLLLCRIADYPCMQSCVNSFCAEIMSLPQFWHFLKQEGCCGSSSKANSKLLTPQLSFASDAVESIETLVPACVCMFSQSWSLWLAMFESNLCTSVKFLGSVLHHGLGVYGEAWRARANVCSCDYKYAGWAQGDCFPSVPVCSYDVEWHLFLRSVPRLSREERLMQVLEGGGHFFFQFYSLACSCLL